MNVTHKELAIALGALALTVGCTTTPNSSTQTQQSPQLTAATNTTDTSVRVDGSSTVYPITQAVAKEFQSTQGDQAQISVDFSGTSGGFKKFCAGEIDVTGASRPILTAEMEACNKNSVRYIELPVAFDALTVAVHPQNNWAQEITVAELKRIWEPAAEGKITRWNQVRAAWPDRPLKLYGAGKQSGTFDYFTEAVVGETRASRNDYVASEDDNVLVEGISKDPNALGYFGFSYLEENQNKLKALAVDNGEGAVIPSRQTVENNEYQPLSRPLFIYVNAQYAQKKPAVKEFVNFYNKQAPTLVSSVGYVPLPEEAYDLNERHFYTGKVGTVFEGEAELNITISELLRRQAKF